MGAWCADNECRLDITVTVIAVAAMKWYQLTLFNSIVIVASYRIADDRGRWATSTAVSSHLTLVLGFIELTTVRSSAGNS